MAASPKPKAAPPAKVAAKPATRRAAPAKPFLRFFHSAELRKKTLSVLALIENAPDATGAATADVTATGSSIVALGLALDEALAQPGTVASVTTTTSGNDARRAKQIMGAPCSPM